jgi:ribosomal-protein-serine acetyltransferase
MQSPTFTLNPLRQKHATELFKLIDLNRVHLAKYLAWVDKAQSVADEENFIKIRTAAMDRNEVYTQGIFIEDELVGIVEYHRLDHENNIGEIGYWLAASHTGQGIMTAAVRELLKIGFEQLNLFRIEIHVLTSNEASANIAKRLGFKYEATLRGIYKLHGKHQDQDVYTLFAS